MRRYVELIVSFRWYVLLGVLLITGLLVSQIGHLKIAIDPNRFLPQSHPYVSTSDRVEDLFGSRSVMVIGITAVKGTIYDPDILAKVDRITAKLRSVPGVVKTDILSFSARKAKSINGNAQGMEVRPLMSTVPTDDVDMQALRQRVASNPAYRGIIVSGDDRSVAIVANFQDPPQGFRTIVDSVKPIIDAERDSSVRIATAGLPVLLGTLEVFSQRLSFLMPLAMLLIGTVLWFAFRSIQGLALPLLTATLAVLWSLGIMSVFHVPLDVFNATTPVLILAVASGHAVQILKRYYEEYARQSLPTPGDLRGASRRAVVESLTRVGPVMLVAGVVAALGFLSLMIIEISSVRTFGVMAACGILSSLALELTLIPALRAMIKPPKVVQQGTEPGRVGRAMSRLAELISGRQAAYLALSGLAVFAVAIWGSARIRFDDALKDYFFDTLPVIQDDQHLNTAFAGTNTLYVLVESKSPGRMQDPDVLKAIDGMQKFLQRDPAVGGTLSLANFVRRMNMAMHGDDPRYDTIPDARGLSAQYLFLYSSSGDPGDFDAYVDNDYQHADIKAFLKEHDSAKLERLVGELKEFARRSFPSDISVSYGGSVAQGTAIHEIIARAKILNMLQLAGVFFLLTALIFRSVIAGILVLVPLAMTVAVNFGLMGWTGIPFNINNSITAAMAVGVGADYVIYLLYRLREEHAGNGSSAEAVRRSLMTAGSAIVFVAVSVAAGYSVLMLDYGFWTHIWMGILICTAMIVSALTAISLVPVLVVWLRPAFIFQTRPAHLAPVVPALLLALLPGGAAIHEARADAAPSAEQIMELNFRVDRVAGSQAKVALRLKNERGEERVRQSVTTTKLEDNGVDNQRLVRFNAPADVKGTSILLVEHSKADDDMWIYLPAFGKTRRLVASNKRDSFVGSDFSYGDVIGYPVDDWHHKLVGEDTVVGEPCYLIESVPASSAVRDTSGYSKRLSAISKSRYVTLRVEIWDTEGEKLKVEEYGDFQNVDAAHGKWVAMHSTSRNLETGHSSDVVFSDYHVDPTVQQSAFTVRALESAP